MLKLNPKKMEVLVVGPQLTLGKNVVLQLGGVALLQKEQVPVQGS